MSQSIPEGFLEMPFNGNFDERIAPLYYRFLEDEAQLGLRVLSKHCNYQGVLHGGAMATLVDVGMGSAVRLVSRGRMRIVTASMTVDYLGSAVAGDWVLCVGRPLKQGKRMLFSECLVHAEGADGKRRMICRANAVYAPVPARGEGPNVAIFEAALGKAPADWAGAPAARGNAS